MSRKQWPALACLLAAVVMLTCATVYAQSGAKKADERNDEPVRRAVSQVLTHAGDNFLGVQTEEVTRENAGRFQVSGEPRGVGVAQVLEDGPAAKVGLQKGDVIVRFDSEPVTSAAKLRRLIREAAPEQAVRLAILRGGAEREVTVKLGRHEQGALGSFRLPEGQGFQWDDDVWKDRAEEWKKFGDQWERQGDEWQKRGEQWRLQGEELRKQLENLPRGNFAVAFGPSRRIGVTTTPLTEQLADYFGVSERRGVLVTSVASDSPAAKAGLKAGDVITEADGERLEDASHLARVINRKDEGDVTLSVVRDRARRSLRVTPEKRERPEGFVLPARPDAPAAELFALPHAEVRGGRA